MTKKKDPGADTPRPRTRTTANIILVSNCTTPPIHRKGSVVNEYS